MKISWRILAILPLMVTAFALVAMLGEHFTNEAEAEKPNACNINHQSVIEIGATGSGKPQRVHQTWRIGDDCALMLIRDEKIKDINASQEGQFSVLDSCTNVQLEQVMDTAAGSDRTRLDLATNWCYDGWVVTWWASPPAWNRWAGTCHEVVGGNRFDSWSDNPWEAKVEAYGNYDEVCLTYVYQHTLYNKIFFRGDGSATCYATHSGSFIPGYDIDIECYYF